MASSAKDIPSTAYKPPGGPVGLEPATVIRSPSPESQSTNVPVPGSASATLGKLFPADETRGVQGELPSGLKLGEYVVESRIGAGGMGAVFKARDERLDRLVALKILSPSQATDPGAVKRFQNEARAAARLDHDNIARIYGVGEDQGLHYIAFEYVEGVTVRELIRQRGTVDPRETIDFMLQISVALKHTAAAGVVHRDIKPSNLIITPQGRAKLVDWGLARKERVDENSLDLTASGTTLGTFDYISPEQARDPRSVDVRSDIYSLGCTSYHMLTGSPPYAEGTVLQKLLDHQGKAAPDPREKNPNVPAELSRIVRKMMASDPSERYWTPQALTNDLLVLAADSGMRPVHPDGLTWRSQQDSPSGRIPKGMFWWWLGSFVAACLVAVVGDRWVVSQNSTFPPQWSAENQAVVPGDPLTPQTNLQQITNRDSGMIGTFDPSLFDSNAESGLGPNPFPVIPDSDRRLEFLGGFSSLVTNSKLTEKLADSRLWEFPDLSAGLDDNSFPESERGAISANVEKELASQPIVPTAGGTSRPGGMRAPATLESVPEAIFHILAANGEMIQTVSDLETAINVVPDEGTIEFHSQQGAGTLFRMKPLQIIDKSITIRSGNSSQMVLRFESPLTGEEGRGGDFINIKSGSLTLSNLHLQVLTPRAVSQPRALFSLEGTGRLRCRETTVTLDSRHRNGVVVVRLNRSGLQTVDAMRVDRANDDGQRRIQFQDCVVRGAGDFLLQETSEPAYVEVSRSLLALSGTLIRYHGDNNTRNQIDMLEVRLSRVAGVLEEGVLRLDLGNSISRQPMNIHVSAEDSILIGQPEQSLVHVSAAMDNANLQNLFSWDGVHNLYGGWERYLSIRGLSNPDGGAISSNYETWTRSTGKVKEVNSRLLRGVGTNHEAASGRFDQWTARKFLSVLQSGGQDKAIINDLPGYGPEIYDLPVPPPLPDQTAPDSGS